MRTKELGPVISELIPLRQGGAHEGFSSLRNRNQGRAFPTPLQDRHQIAGNPVESRESHDQQDQSDHSAEHSKPNPPSQSRKGKTPKQQQEQSDKPDDGRRDVSVLALPSIELPYPNNRARRQHQNDRNRPPAHGPTGRDSGRMVFFLV